MNPQSANEIIAKLESNDRVFVAEIQSVIEAIVCKWRWNGVETVGDIAQECFMKLLQNLRQGRFKGDSSLKTYAYAIIRNTCIDYYRSSKTAKTVDVETFEIADDSPNPEAVLEKKQTRVAAARVLQSLPKECRKLWAAVFFGRRNYLETAQLMGISEGTVKRKMWECRQLARRELKIAESREL